MVFAFCFGTGYFLLFWLDLLLPGFSNGTGWENTSGVGIGDEESITISDCISRKTEQSHYPFVIITGEVRQTVVPGSLGVLIIAAFHVSIVFPYSKKLKARQLLGMPSRVG